ncbi:CoA transferase [Nocardioides sp. SOB44]|uniref:CoA transferase n=1 Tax=Nocardioides cremeus TaxID=3058044 RepID=A0ABT8TN81_9ACTN|nr:CoA transferase [Nocardioides cremeus]MDO3395419.1 CoA transferase [Nocardioides cremeus]
MALTGWPDGPPRAAPGRAASLVRDAVQRVVGYEIPGLLGERAAYAGLRRNAPWSCGGAARTLPTADGHLVLSMPRASDRSLVPALVEEDLGDDVDPWEAVAGWAAARPGADAEERLRLLGMAGGVVPAQPPTDRPPVLTSVLGQRRPAERPLVVDLTSLWAGPLCAHLLGLRGVEVVKVESRSRPDGARSGPPVFFELLHAGSRSLVLDFDTELDTLRALVARADLVLEASRPRALRQLGLIAEEVVAAGTSWLSITARGRDSDAVGFGDDVAVAGGLWLREGACPVPVGDAVADPLGGVTAALHAVEAMAAEEARLVDVSMLHVAAEAAPGAAAEHAVRQRDDAWWVECADGEFPVADPTRRR